MSQFILDTDILTLYREGHPSVCRRISGLGADLPAITVISVEEQLTGWYALLRRAKGRDELAYVYFRLTETVRFLPLFKIYTFSVPAIEIFEQLKALRLNVGKMDLRIAAIALEAGATLVTRNRRDFERIPGLALEDWSLESPGESPT